MKEKSDKETGTTISQKGEKHDVSRDSVYHSERKRKQKSTKKCQKWKKNRKN